MKDISNILMQLKEDLYSKNKDKSSTISHVATEMKDSEIQNYIKYLLHSRSTRSILSESDRINLKLIIDIAQALYNYSGTDTGISDPDYDKLYEMLESDEITVPIVNRENVTHHTYKSLRGTLTKIYFLDENDEVDNPNRKGLPDWISSREKLIYQKTGKQVDLRKENIFVFPKWDGVSIIFEFKKSGELIRALTRGYTELNECQDVTHIFRGIVVGPKMDHDYGLKTEVMMKEKDFRKYQKMESKLGFKNSRSIVSSIINSNERDSRVNDLVIQSLRTCYIDRNGEESLQEVTEKAFQSPYIKCKLGDTEKIREFAEEHRTTDGLRCDGAVIYICNENLRSILGRKDNKNLYEVAYKFTEETGYTKVKDIKFTVGTLGKISPVASIEPITLKGNRISKVSLGSIGRCKELNLAKGDTVKILYDIIPYLVFSKNTPGCKRSGDDPIEIPTICPYCGNPLEYDDNETLYCNNENCDCRKQGKILNYLEKLHIANISDAIVKLLYDEGYLKSILDLYKIEKHRESIEDIHGLGYGVVNNIINEINSHKTIKDYEFLGSIGIRGIGSRKFKAILDQIPLDDLLDFAKAYNKEKISLDYLTEIPGIQEKTAKLVVKGINENMKLIKELRKILTIIHVDSKYTVCFSNIRSGEMEKWIEKHGGEVVQSVNEKLSLLIVDSLSSDSSKIQKAKKYGIPVIPLDSAKEYISNRFGK